jgi:hypothetical protein
MLLPLIEGPHRGTEPRFAKGIGWCRHWLVALVSEFVSRVSPGKSIGTNLSYPWFDSHSTKAYDCHLQALLTLRETPADEA